MARNRHVSSDHEHCSCVTALEADIRDLKRRLAVQAAQAPTERATRRKESGEWDWLDELPDQDRRYFVRKMRITER